MKNKTHILILFLLLLAFPASVVFACGSSSEKEKTEKSSCSKQDNSSEKKSCCGKEKQDNNGCGGTCEHSSCQCPMMAKIPVIVTDYQLSTDNNFRLLVVDWAYTQRIPKPVYLSIWQPPKIS